MSLVRTLRTAPLGAVTTLARPETDEKVTLDSPAGTIFTDFVHHHPVVLVGDLPVEQAEAHMQRSHVKLVLVVDDADDFLGVLSFSDLSGERFQHLLGQGYTRHVISVKDVMVAREELSAVLFEDIADATIGCIVDTLKREHRQHCLVMDEQPKIRGIFSASDIARRLHVPVDISQAPTFADICHEVYQHAAR